MINMYNMVEVGEQLYAGLPVEPAHARTGAGGSLKSAQVQPVELDLAARALTKKKNLLKQLCFTYSAAIYNVLAWQVNVGPGHYPQNTQELKTNLRVWWQSTIREVIYDVR